MSAAHDWNFPTGPTTWHLRASDPFVQRLHDAVVTGRLEASAASLIWVKWFATKLRSHFRCYLSMCHEDLECYYDRLRAKLPPLKKKKPTQRLMLSILMMAQWAFDIPSPGYHMTRRKLHLGREDIRESGNTWIRLWQSISPAVRRRWCSENDDGIPRYLAHGIVQAYVDGRYTSLQNGMRIVTYDDVLDITGHTITAPAAHDSRAIPTASVVLILARDSAGDSIVSTLLEDFQLEHLRQGYHALQDHGIKLVDEGTQCHAMWFERTATICPLSKDAGDGINNKRLRDYFWRLVKLVPHGGTLCLSLHGFDALTVDLFSFSCFYQEGLYDERPDLRLWLRVCETTEKLEQTFSANGVPDGWYPSRAGTDLRWTYFDAKDLVAAFTAGTMDPYWVSLMRLYARGLTARYFEMENACLILKPGRNQLRGQKFDKNRANAVAVRSSMSMQDVLQI